MHDRRGGRTQITPKSLETAPLPGGSPEVTDVGDQFEDDSHEDSPQQTSTAPVNGRSQQVTDKRQQTGGNNGEHPDDESESVSDSAESPTHSSDRTPEEESRWQELMGQNTTLEKGKVHADQKITEQGQENSQLRQQLAQQEDEIGRLKQGFGKILSQSRPNGGRQDTEPAGTDYDSFSQGDESEESDEKNGFDAEFEIDRMKQVVSGMFHEQRDFKTQREQETQVASVTKDLGVDAETAANLLDLKENGNLSDLAEALELSTLPAEARRVKREARERQRGAVSHPTTTGFSTDTDEADADVLRTRAEKLASLPDSQRKRREVDTFLGQHPDAYGYLAEATGFNI